MESIKNPIFKSTNHIIAVDRSGSYGDKEVIVDHLGRGSGPKKYKRPRSKNIQSFRIFWSKK